MKVKTFQFSLWFVHLQEEYSTGAPPDFSHSRLSRNLLNLWPVFLGWQGKRSFCRGNSPLRKCYFWGSFIAIKILKHVSFSRMAYSYCFLFCFGSNSLWFDITRQCSFHVFRVCEMTGCSKRICLWDWVATHYTYRWKLKTFRLGKKLSYSRGRYELQLNVMTMNSIPHIRNIMPPSLLSHAQKVPI